MQQMNHEELNQQRSRLADSASSEMDQEVLQSGRRPEGKGEMTTRVGLNRFKRQCMAEKRPRNTFNILHGVGRNSIVPRRRLRYDFFS